MKPAPKTTVKCPECEHQFQVALTSVTCLRCGHRWVPRQWDVRQCPRCQSVRWDEAREGEPPSKKNAVGVANSPVSAAAAAAAAAAPPTKWFVRDLMTVAGVDDKLKIYEERERAYQGLPATSPTMAGILVTLQRLRARREELLPVEAMSLAELDEKIPLYECKLAELADTDPVHAAGTRGLAAMRVRRDGLLMTAHGQGSSGAGSG